MHLSLAFLLSFVSLAFGAGSGAFFFLLWRESRYKDEFAFASCVGIFLQYLFQIPFILANAGVSFELTRFNGYFLAAFAANFIGLAFIFKAVFQRLGGVSLKESFIAIAVWFVGLVLFLTQSQTGKLLLEERLPLVAGIFLLFVPLRIFCFVMIGKYYVTAKKYMRSSVFILQMALILQILNHFLSVRKMLYYPKNFWFIAIVDDNTLLISGMFTALLLTLGLFKIFSKTKSITFAK